MKTANQTNNMLEALTAQIDTNDVELAGIASKIRRLQERAAKLRLHNAEMGNQIHALKIAAGTIVLPYPYAEHRLGKANRPGESAG